MTAGRNVFNELHAILIKRKQMSANGFALAIAMLATANGQTGRVYSISGLSPRERVGLLAGLSGRALTAAMAEVRRELGIVRVERRYVGQHKQGFADVVLNYEKLGSLVDEFTSSGSPLVAKSVSRLNSLLDENHPGEAPSRGKICASLGDEMSPDKSRDGDSIEKDYGDSTTEGDRPDVASATAGPLPSTPLPQLPSATGSLPDYPRAGVRQHTDDYAKSTDNSGNPDLPSKDYYGRLKSIYNGSTDTILAAMVAGIGGLDKEGATKILHALVELHGDEAMGQDAPGMLQDALSKKGRWLVPNATKRLQAASLDRQRASKPRGGAAKFGGLGGGGRY